jgi:hypothetical protein
MLPNINSINHYLNNSLSTKPSFSTTYSKLKLEEKTDRKYNNNNE